MIKVAFPVEALEGYSTEYGCSSINQYGIIFEDMVYKVDERFLNLIINNNIQFHSEISYSYNFYLILNDRNYKFYKFGKNYILHEYKEVLKTKVHKQYVKFGRYNNISSFYFYVNEQQYAKLKLLFNAERLSE